MIGIPRKRVPGRAASGRTAEIDPAGRLQRLDIEGAHLGFAIDVERDDEAVQGSTGRAHTESEVKSYLQDAGFTDVAAHPFVPGVLTRTAGRKPG